MAEEQNQKERSKSLYNIPDLYISFKEYVPGWPSWPVETGRLFGQWLEFEISIQTDTEVETVPAVTTSYSWGTTSTAAAHTINHTETKHIAKQFTVFYVYSKDGSIRKCLPEDIQILNYKTS